MAVDVKVNGKDILCGGGTGNGEGDSSLDCSTMVVSLEMVVIVTVGVVGEDMVKNGVFEVFKWNDGVG